MNPMQQVLMLCATALIACPAGAVNKCTGADGRVSYQEAPCASGAGQELRLHVAPPTPAQAGDAEFRARTTLRGLQADNEMSAAIREHRPLVGMTTTQLQQAMGDPVRVNSDNYGGGAPQNQLIFERGNTTWYVYTRADRVTAVQQQQGVAHAHRPRAAAPQRCPTGQEIRDAITSAGSISLSAQEKEARWRAIREMQRCGR